VRIGINDGRFSELLEGLGEGDQVIVGLPGQQVGKKTPLPREQHGFGRFL
jgi:hypothetical protein